MLNDRQAAKVGRAVASPRRVQLLKLLDKKPNLAVGQIAQQMRLRQPTVTEHLKKMIDGGLVVSKPQGNRSLVQVTGRGQAVLMFLGNLA